MALAFTAQVTRTLLGLGNLNVNDHLNYITTTQIMGGTVSWQRNAVSSPYVDGDVTVSRRRANVTDQFVINVLGATHAQIKTNLTTLINAFMQDEFDLLLSADGATYQYKCETSDYSVEWNHAKWHDNLVTVSFQVMRKPIAIQGV